MIDDQVKELRKLGYEVSPANPHAMLVQGHGHSSYLPKADPEPWDQLIESHEDRAAQAEETPEKTIERHRRDGHV